MNGEKICLLSDDLRGPRSTAMIGQCSARDREGIRTSDPNRRQSRFQNREQSGSAVNLPTLPAMPSPAAASLPLRITKCNTESAAMLNSLTVLAPSSCFPPLPRTCPHMRQTAKERGPGTRKHATPNLIMSTTKRRQQWPMLHNFLPLGRDRQTSTTGRYAG